MNYGYLITSQQVIAYAKWYLHNPLRYFANRYHKYGAGDSGKVRINKENYCEEETETYDYQDVAKVHATIKNAKKHPHKLFFGPAMAHSLWPTYSGVMGFKSGKYRHIGDELTDWCTVPDYLKHLKRKTFMSFPEVWVYICKINRVQARRNNRRKQWNDHCDQMIKNVADSSSKSVHYRKFLGPVRFSETFDDYIRHEVRHDEAGQAIKDVYSKDEYHSYDDVNDPVTHVYDDFRNLSIDKSGQVYYKHKPAGVHNSIAYWAYQKSVSLELIDLSQIRRMPAFKEDLEYLDLPTFSSRQPYGRKYTISDPHEVCDYQRFIQSKDLIKE